MSHQVVAPQKKSTERKVLAVFVDRMRICNFRKVQKSIVKKTFLYFKKISARKVESVCNS